MKCKKMLQDLIINLPFIDVIQMMLSMRSLMKGLISGKISEDSNFMIISKECSAVLQNKTIRKLGDPGKFVLSLQVGRTVFSCSLVDLGSSVNLIPYSVARRYVPISYHTLQSVMINLTVARIHLYELNNNSPRNLVQGFSENIKHDLNYFLNCLNSQRNLGFQNLYINSFYC